VAVRRALSSLALALALVVVTATASAASRTTVGNSIGAHSMLYLDDALSAKDAMFREAAAMGVSAIRLDIALSSVFVDPGGPPHWGGVDEYMQLAQRYRLRVLANLLGTPWYMADCPLPSASALDYRCPPHDAAAWGRDAGAIAAHTRGVIDDFEIVNEPDGHWAFLGTPRQYAAMLASAYDAIHSANPNARVALGGLMSTGPSGKAWLRAMLAAPGLDATHTFDIANIHIRTRANRVRTVIWRWRRYFGSQGFRGPLWVTETGYPADSTWQRDPAYRGGPEAQARYLSDVIPAMLGAGAAQVFVTERDALAGPFASEGVLDTDDPLTAFPHWERRPAFFAVHALAEATLRGHGATPTRPFTEGRTPSTTSSCAPGRRDHLAPARMLGKRRLNTCGG
jgi:hypothetical protein